MTNRAWLKLAGAMGLGLAVAGAGPLSAAQAQGSQSPPSRQDTKQDSKLDSIPKEFMPPAKMCRVWIDGVPPAQQPAPTDCPTAIQKKPANGRVIYGDDKDKGKLDNKLPIKGFTTPTKKPPLIPPDVAMKSPEELRAERESKRITDGQLFGDEPTSGSASSYPGGPPSQYGPMGSYGGLVAPGGVIIGQGQLNDPRYFAPSPYGGPPGTGSSVCLDRDGDGWCDDARYGPPVCLDVDKDGRCDDLPGYASQAYPQVLPQMRAVLDVIQGRPSTEVMTWLGTNEFILRVPDEGRGGVPWRAIFLDASGQLQQVWTDTNRDGRADRVEIFKNGQRTKLIQR